MFALSVKEPWATLIAGYGKDVENRRWSTDYRGPLLICASATPCPKDDVGWDCLAAAQSKGVGHGEPMPGWALCVVDLADVNRRNDSPWCAAGQYHWRLENVRPLQYPFQVKGKLGLFKVDDASILAALGDHHS